MGHVVYGSRLKLSSRETIIHEVPVTPSPRRAINSVTKRKYIKERILPWAFEKSLLQGVRELRTACILATWAAGERIVGGFSVDDLECARVVDAVLKDIVYSFFAVRERLVGRTELAYWYWRSAKC